MLRAYNITMQSNSVDSDKLSSQERSPHLFCDICMHYPIEPVHGHFMCPACHNVTKCCELGPMTMEGAVDQ